MEGTSRNVISEIINEESDMFLEYGDIITIFASTNQERKDKISNTLKGRVTCLNNGRRKCVIILDKTGSKEYKFKSVVLATKFLKAGKNSLLLRIKDGKLFQNRYLIKLKEMFIDSKFCL